MSKKTRRVFLKTAGAGLAGAAMLTNANAARAQGANNRFSIALIGPGGMGTGHLRTLVTRKDVDITYVCDPDRNRAGAAAELVQKAMGRAPRAVADMRRVLEDKTVDAVFIATPDHWHGPATILACNAGKHVYVEKPCSHNIREGRLMIEAARKNRRIVQVGTQSRSTETVRTALQMLREGAIGDILVAKVWNSQLRRSIGRGKPSSPPEQLDYDLWLGPAPMVPYQANRAHGVWRWWYDYGAGDMGNDGVHNIDLAVGGLGVDTHPTMITALGGKYFFDDDQQFPDTQTVVCEYPAADKNGRKKQLIFEQRIWSPYVQEGYENGNAFYGTNGMLILGHTVGWRLYGPRNKEIKTMTGQVNLPAHHDNFFECIRSGRQPHADIAIGHLSASICHLGNIATRMGKVLQFDPKTEQITNDKE
ncbi:MAG: Gfo/Idh/MocA family oxidoreductase, partial [Gemmataceae bacterium]|nr:Gfo/Idh/MocA family oxidoreductase [Gemmataceae bacterium]